MTGNRNTAETAASASPSSATAAWSSTATTAAGAVGGSPGLTATVIKWAEERRISRATLAAFGVTSAIEVMEDLGRTEVARFPYCRGANPINAKYRAIADKKFKMQPGGELRFWNLDTVLAGGMEVVYIFEGEMDVLAAFEAGIPRDQILSVPNGAPQSATAAPEEADRYRYAISGLEEGLGAARRFVIATDNDGPGRALRQDLVNILGPARCWFVEWPGSIKDANELLIKGSSGELLDCLEGEQKEWPVEGLFRLSQIPDPPPITTWNIGIAGCEEKIRLSPGKLTIWTGHPGHGKTTLAAQVAFDICRRYRLKAAFASFETGAKPHHQRNVRRFMFGKWNPTPQECDEADRWNDEHFLWMSHPHRRPGFNWFMDTAEVAVVRHGAKIVVLDPWNKVEADRPDHVRETDWIRDRLNDMLDFARSFGVLMLVICHPAKGDQRSRDRRPELEDIAGSKHWDNIADQGFAVFRPKVFDEGARKTEAMLFHLKTRFEELGHECKVNLTYDLATGRFRPTEPPLAARPHWSDTDA